MYILWQSKGWGRVGEVGESGGGGDTGWLKASFEMCAGVYRGESGGEAGGWMELTHIEWAPRSLQLAARARSEIEGDQLHHHFFARGHIDSCQAVGSDMTAGYVWAWLPGCLAGFSSADRGGELRENPASVFSFPQGKYPRSHLPN